MSLKKRIEKLEKEQKKMLECFEVDYSLYSYLGGLPYELTIKPEKVSTEKAQSITLKELAEYVLDKKPIIRNAQKIVYGEERKSE